ncbi:hypothetical protein [Bradyrhizobium icense]|uniref:Tail fiber domain-containing protein n=1 Tax=Bradyrhizobium icense TaxID=1274631 RepID=A0A1B1UDD7_9BRAD|nr:hypothetical protein [Bradyrhizobium icense]ANW00686.1 hypothetical protein LMTR13_11405 [Bradyrhizobium icense]
MGIFDIFTGDSAGEAAHQNRLMLAQNKREGTDILRQGEASSLASLDKAGGYYAPLASKYGAATTLGLDALNVNGPEGAARARAAFQASPGYDWMVDQSLEGIARKANALGVSAGGNTLAALSDRAGNLANQEYGSWLDRLQGYVSPEMAAVSGQAGAEAGKVPVYQGTASSIANLGTNTANAVANQNTQQANAEMQGSANLWGLGLNLAKLGASAFSGGTSLLGGK